MGLGLLGFRGRVTRLRRALILNGRDGNVGVAVVRTAHAARSAGRRFPTLDERVYVAIALARSGRVRQRRIVRLVAWWGATRMGSRTGAEVLLRSPATIAATSANLPT